MQTKNLPKSGEQCPACGCEILDWELSSLPTVAFKKEMYDACFLENENVDYATRESKETLVILHEDTSIQ